MSRPLSTPPGRKPGIPVAPMAALGVLALLAALAGGCRVAPKVRYEEESTATLPFAPQTSVLVENARGTVHLATGDSGSVRIEAHKRAYGFSEREAKKLAAEVKVDVDRVGDRMEIHVQYPGRIASSNVRVEMFGENVAMRRAAVDLTVFLPAGTPTRVETRSGDLYVDDASGSLEFGTTNGDAEVEKHEGSFSMRSTSGDASVGQNEGDLEMNTTSGDLKLKHLGGNLHYDSTSGDLDAADVDGSLTVRTVSGDVVARRAGGPVLVTTTSGDVTVRNVPGDVEIRSSSGDVTASVVSKMNRIALETTSGAVHLSLPEPLEGKLQIHTASGEVQAQIPMTLQRATRRQLEGVLGAGTATTTVQTSSGDVTIARGGDKP